MQEAAIGDPLNYFAGWLPDEVCYWWGKLFNSSWEVLRARMACEAIEIGLVQRSEYPYLVWGDGISDVVRWAFVSDPSNISLLRDIFGREENVAVPACYIVVNQVDPSDERGEVLFDIFRMTSSSYLQHHNRVYTAPLMSPVPASCMVAVERPWAPEEYFSGWLEDEECYVWGELFDSSWEEVVLGMSTRAAEIGLLQEERWPVLVWRDDTQERARWVFVNDPSEIEQICNVFNDEENANSPTCFVVVRQHDPSDVRGDTIFDIFRMNSTSYLYHHNRVYTKPVDAGDP